LLHANSIAIFFISGFVAVNSFSFLIKIFFYGLLCTLMVIIPMNLCATTTPKDIKEFIQPEKPFLRLTEFQIPIFHSLSPYHTVIIDCTLEMEEDSWALARLNIPYIYHHIFKDFYYALNFLWRANEPPNKKIIKKRVLYVYNKNFAHKWPIKNIHINEIKVQK